LITIKVISLHHTLEIYVPLLLSFRLYVSRKQQATFTSEERLSNILGLRRRLRLRLRLRQR
jgi:hypothetical protein